MNEPNFTEEDVERLKNTNILQLGNEIHDVITHDLIHEDTTVFDFLKNYFRR
jgi:hypothetical protein